MLEVELVALPFVVLACAQHSKVGSGIARRQHNNDRLCEKPDSKTAVTVAAYLTDFPGSHTHCNHRMRWPAQQKRLWPTSSSATTEIYKLCHLL